MTMQAYESWGRTRRPKALHDDNSIASKQTATTVTTIAVNQLNNDLNDATAGHNGYSTENQQYLHIQIECDATTDTLSLFAYNYAFGAWAHYHIPVGIKNGGDTTVNDAYIAATWTSIDGKKMVTVPIHGIDRVAFVNDGSLGNMVVRAACTSF